jgi:hypothetical protein
MTDTLDNNDVHLMDLRLYVNAGMAFPACQADVELLDLDCTYWEVTRVRTKITCPRCRQLSEQER